MIGVAVILVLAGVLVVWGVDLGRRIGLLSGSESALTDAQEVRALQVELTQLAGERDRLSTALTAATAAQQRGAVRIDVLEEQNTRLSNALAEAAAALEAAKSAAAVPKKVHVVSKKH